MTTPMIHPTETVALTELRPHPRNYREHTPAQLDQLIASLNEHGMYRPVVVTRDGTILAGHGLVLAARQAGWSELAVTRLDVDPDSPAAWKVIVGDNELARLAEVDDRALADLLAAVAEADSAALIGTGFTDEDLGRLLVLTHDEIGSDDAMEHWRGMPDYEAAEDRLRVTVNFASEEDRAEFARRLDLSVSQLTSRCWWPPQGIDDAIAVGYRDA